MRSTLNLDEALLKDALKATGVQEKTRLIHMGLEALLREVARKRLAKLYGKVKGARVPPRRRWS